MIISEVSLTLLKSKSRVGLSGGPPRVMTDRYFSVLEIVFKATRMCVPKSSLMRTVTGSAFYKRLVL